MAKHVWSVLAQRVIQDRTSNQLSLIDLIDVISVKFDRPPDSEKQLAFQLNLQLVSSWMRSNPATPEQGTTRLSVVSPTGKRSVGSGELLIDLRTTPNARTIFRTGKLPYTGPGTYGFVVELRQGKSWKRVASVPFEVEVTGEDASSEATND